MKTVTRLVAPLAQSDAGALRLEQSIREYFQRDIASQTCITGAIDLTHSAGPQQRDDFVRLEFYPRGESHRRAQL